ncbi:MAG: hypothetical protein HY718_11430, partial [Planctomycetes bacterium]|nr:hypothetical protein [Planctomycetota bacterium]
MCCWRRAVAVAFLGGFGVLAHPSAAGAAFIVVTSPTSTSVWDAGTTHNITWSDSGVVGYVFIDLYQAGVFRQDLAYVPVSDRTYSWDICEYIGDGN